MSKGDSEVGREMIAKAREVLHERKTAYQLCFSSPAGQAVLEDLAKFCFATDTVFDPNQRQQDRIIGRNDVWRRVQEHLNLSSADLYKRYA